LNIETHQWTLLPNPFQKERWGHSLVFDQIVNPTCVYLFGGWDSSSQYNSLWEYDFYENKTREIEMDRRDCPSARAGHSANIYRERMYIFGGAQCQGGPYKFYNDLYAFSFASKEWRKIEATGTIPEARAQHGSVLLGDYLIILGGYNADQQFDNGYALDLRRHHWHNLKGKFSSLKKVAGFNTEEFRVRAVRPSIIVLEHMKILILGELGLSIFDFDTKQSVMIDNNISRVCHTMSRTENGNFLLFGGLTGNKDRPENLLEEMCLISL